MSMVGTAIAVSSSMIGTVLLVLPQVFLQYGLLTCLIIVVNEELDIDSRLGNTRLHLLAVGQASQRGRPRHR